MLRLHLKLLPVLSTTRFIILVNTLFSASLIPFVYVYFRSSWGMSFQDITAIYFRYFLTGNLLILVVIKYFYLNSINYSTTSFLTEYLVSGVLPSKLLQTNKSSKIFRRIFKTPQNLSNLYRSTKNEILKSNYFLKFVNFKHSFIAYCTARNDENAEHSARYFMLFQQTYSRDFIKSKLLYNSLRFVFLLSCMSLVAFPLSIMTPNIFEVPNYTNLHFFSGVVLGYGLYKIFFSQSILNREIVWTLRFLQDKTLPITLKLKD